MTIFGWIFIIVSLVITFAICKVINRNTIGTTFAYIKRFFIVWVFVVAILAVLWSKISGKSSEQTQGESKESVFNSNTNMGTSDKGNALHTHDYSGMIVQEATCTKEGVARYVCSCGASYNEEISKSDHIWQDATCTAAQECVLCGEKVGEETGHSFQSGICVKCLEFDMEYAEIYFPSDVITVVFGETIPLECTYHTYNEDIQVTFSSSDENVACFDESGKLIGKAVGTCTIEITPPKGIAARATVNVIENLAEKSTLIIPELPYYVAYWTGNATPMSSGTITDIKYSISNCSEPDMVELSLELVGYKNDETCGSDMEQPVRMVLALKNSSLGEVIFYWDSVSERIFAGEEFLCSHTVTIPAGEYELVIYDMSAN